MREYRINKNNDIFRNAVKKLQLRFPVAEISKKVIYPKGNISDFLNGKKTVSDEFLRKTVDAVSVIIITHS